MTITHSELVANLAKPGADILKTMDADSMHVTHMLLGLSGEIGELMEAQTATNATEEGGDAYFYLEGIWQKMPFPRPTSYTLPPDEFATRKHMDTAVIYMGRVVDALKKSIIYQKPAKQVETIEALLRVDMAIAFVLDSWGVTKEQAIAANIAKLKVRYKSGNYSNEQAQARADKVEMQGTEAVTKIEAVETTKQLFDVTDPANPKPIETFTKGFSNERSDLPPDYPYKEVPKGAWGTKPEDYGNRFDGVAAHEQQRLDAEKKANGQ